MTSTSTSDEEEFRLPCCNGECSVCWRVKISSFITQLRLNPLLQQQPAVFSHSDEIKNNQNSQMDMEQEKRGVFPKEQLSSQKVLAGMGSRDSVNPQQGSQPATLTDLSDLSRSLLI